MVVRGYENPGNNVNHSGNANPIMHLLRNVEENVGQGSNRE